MIRGVTTFFDDSGQSLNGMNVQNDHHVGYWCQVPELFIQPFHGQSSFSLVCDGREEVSVENHNHSLVQGGLNLFCNVLLAVQDERVQLLAGRKAPTFS